MTLAVVLSDLHNIFALISKETTNLSLAFAPPKEHWDAIHATAKKLNDLASKLLFGLGLLRQKTTGEGITEHVLAKQWRMASVTVLECLKELSDVCVRIYTALGDKAIKADQRKHILTNTSHVWKSVERTETLPKDERSAFVIAMKSTITTFDDALEEVEELSKREAKGKGRAVNQDESEEEQEDEKTNADDKDEDDDDFDFDDFEDDDTPISQEELDIVQAAYQYMKLVKALLRKIATLQGEAIQYGRLCESTERIASLQDELASALHPPQDIGDVRSEAKRYRQVVSEVLESLLEDPSAEEVAKGVENLSIKLESAASGTPKEAEMQRWFKACHGHLDKASSALLLLCEDGPER